MSVTRPPAFATWLLTRLIARNARESLLGDLAEQFQRRRSSAWYSRQVLAAIVVTNIYDTAHRRLQLVRNVALGCAVVWISQALLFQPLSTIVRHSVMSELMEGAVSPVVRTWPAFTVLWTIDLASYAPIAASYLLGGWLVRLLHPDRPAGVLALTLLVFAVQLTLTTRTALSAHFLPLGTTGFPVPLLFVFTYTGLPTLCLLGGGIWGTGTQHTAVWRRR